MDSDFPLPTVSRKFGTKGTCDPRFRLKLTPLTDAIVDEINNFIYCSSEKKLNYETGVSVKDIVKKLRPFDSTTQALCFKPLTDLGDDAEVRCEMMILKLIEYTQSHLDVMAYDLSNRVIVSHIIAKILQDKIKVTLIADSRNFDIKQSRGIHLMALRNVGANIFIDCKPASEHHNKLMIFDDKVTLTGSYNFSKNAEDKNSENIRVSTKNVKEVKNYFLSRLKEVVQYELYNNQYPSGCIKLSDIPTSTNLSAPDAPWDWNVNLPSRSQKLKCLLPKKVSSKKK